MRVRGLKQPKVVIAENVKGSHPMRVRGLKQRIERSSYKNISVAPRAGAWIETSEQSVVSVAVVSHPVRVRGLKQQIIWDNDAYIVSHPVRVRGLKPCI